MTTGARPTWDRADPAALLRHVAVGALTTLFPASVRLPGRSAAPPEVRLRQLFDAFAAVDVRYADEDVAAAGEQAVRPPDQVLVAPGRANCLDLAVTFAGGCLDAGLHPIIVVVTSADGRTRHALVVAWLRDGAAQPFSDVVLPAEPEWPGMGMRSEWDGPGEFVAVDVAQVARGWPHVEVPATFAAAVAAGGEMVAGPGWVWDVGVDVGLGHRDVRPYSDPAMPVPLPLEPPYHAVRPDDDDGPLASIRARNEIVPFEPRGTLDVLQDWCLADDTEPGRLRLALLHGVGGAGKTRLAAELAHRLVEDDGWYAGFLRRGLTRPGAAAEGVTWLAGVVGPLLVVVDYVEQAESDVLAEHLAVLDGRRSRTVVLFTARSPGDWRRKLDDALDSRGVRTESFPDERLDARHPNGNAVYRKAYRRFSPATGAPDTAPDPPAESSRWTTLEMVMAGWLAARTPRAGLPANRTTLYERLLDREFDNWDAHLRSRCAREAGRPALRAAAAAVSLASPTPEQTTALVEAIGVPRLTSLAPGEIGEMLVRFLSEDDGALSVRPDPLADHLLVTRRWDHAEIDRCVDAVVDASAEDPDAPTRLVANLTRAEDADRTVTRRLAGRTLSCHPGTFWDPALEAAWTRGGPFVPQLEELARAEGTPLPLLELADRIPLGHSALRGLALTAARHACDRESTSFTSAQEQLGHRARSLNNLAFRLSDTGDHAAALTSVTDAVALHRRLADTDPAHLPRLAGSLSNLSNRQSDTGDDAGALTTITEAVTICRGLADADPASLPDLAGYLNNLSNQQSDTGDRAGALATITEAVTTYRRLADTDPAFLPELAMSLTTLSNRQSDTGDDARALSTITEAVTLQRRLADTDPALHIPDLALSLNNLSNRQGDTGDHAGALSTSTEAVTLQRRLADTDPAFLPDLAQSLNNLSNRQGGTGDPAGALATITESVALRRRLADTNPAHLPALAASLSNQSNRLSNTGDLSVALATITEAVTLQRRLAAANPAHLPDLAGSLTNLSNQQSDTGDGAGALVTITEGVTLHRRLAETNPVFLPDLARSLNNQSVRQGDAGDLAGALTTITEAVTLRRRLADTNPAHLPDLASSLNNQAVLQSNTGDPAGALVTITEAVTTYRQAADTNAAHLPDLASSLNTLSNQQSDTGDRAGALATITESVALHRRLADANPAHLPDLTQSLNNLSNRLSDTGDRAGALAIITEAVTTLRRLADTNPAHLPVLASSLNNLSNHQSRTGDSTRALDTITEAVALRRRLADTNPAHLLDLAGSLHNLSVQQSNAGDLSGALVTITEAVATLRRLAVTNPAHLPLLASSLNNQAGQQSRTGDPAGALATITEAVALRRRLADTNPAHLPDLADSLTNLSIGQSATGDPAGALATITEAVALRRRLAVADPAAFLPEFAASLATESVHRAEVERDAAVHDHWATWEATLVGLPPEMQSRLLAFRGAWHRQAGRPDDARADLDRAVRLADESDPASDPAQVSTARLQVRAAVSADAAAVHDEFPVWATVDLPDELIELANIWIRGSWQDRRPLLTDPPAVVDPARLTALATVYCDRPALQNWAALHTAVRGDPSGVALAELDRAQAARDLATAWIAAESWNASQAFLGAHPELRDPAVHDALARLADQDVGRQHLAILRLAEHVPANAVFDAILDPGDARDLLFTVARRGDAVPIADVWLATPHIAADPVAGPLAFVLLRALGEDPEEHDDEIAETTGVLAAQVSARERGGIRSLLVQLSRVRDDRAAVLGRIAGAVAEPRRP